MIRFKKSPTLICVYTVYIVYIQYHTYFLLSSMFFFFLLEMLSAGCYTELISLIVLEDLK